MVVDKTELIEPDTEFIQRIIHMGGQSLKRCFQCGHCSVVCSLSPQQRPFPRKEMLWAQWGLKDRLLRDPDVWLCHGCHDCSTYCPRGAQPGDVLSAIRSYSIAYLAVPRFLAELFSRPAYLPLLLAIPALSLFAFLAGTGRLRIPEGEIVFSRFIPIATIEITGLTIAGVALATVALKLWRFWKNIHESDSAPMSQKRVAGSLIATLVSILRHREFRRCEANRSRFYSHMAIFYGFLLLLAATTGRAIYTWLGWEGQPALSDPAKLAGNLGGLLVLGGLTMVIYRALFRRASTGAVTYLDWFLIGMLYLTTITGFITEAARLSQLPAWAYSLYGVHLVFAFAVLAYLPFSKLAHLFYRTLAMAYAEQAGRKAEAPGPLSS